MYSDNVIIYHNKNCSKSREALKLIESTGIKPIVIDYLSVPIGRLELRNILKMLGMKAAEIVRTKEQLFKDLNIDLKTMGEMELIEILSKNPKLIERPIVVVRDKAIVARPAEKINELLGK